MARTPHYITVPLTAEMRYAIEKIADAERRTKAQVARIALDRYIQSYEATHPELPLPTARAPIIIGQRKANLKSD